MNTLNNKGRSQRTLRRELLALLRGGNAHMTFEGSIAGFPPSYINRKPRNIPYTFWHLLEHMRIAQWDILQFITDPHHVSPDWPESYWPPKGKKADTGQWKKTISQFRGDRAALQKIVLNPRTNLFAPIPHAKHYTLFREILLVADHNSYHISELITLRQIMKIDPPNNW